MRCGDAERTELRALDSTSTTWLIALAAAGIAGGLALLWKGIAGFRAAVSIGDTSTSRIVSLAAGEVRITGIVEPAEVTLTSPLQSRPCVWYRAEVRASVSRNTETCLFDEERAIGFRVRDGSGSIRVFPRDARFDVPLAFEDRTGAFGEAPVGLDLRSGAMYAPTAPVDRELAIAELLTVKSDPVEGFGTRNVDALGIRAGGSRRYEEARLEPGMVVTVLGTAVPFGHLGDPAGHDLMDRHADPLAALEDSEVAASLARAREDGTLLPPGEAWGNAAIPGFGIGRPVRSPELDAGVATPELASAAEAATTERTFDLEPDLLVIAAEPEAPLLVSLGTPDEAVGRHEGRFLLGLLGAALAIASAVVLALALGGSLAG